MLPHDSLSYWFPPYFNRWRARAKKSQRIPKSSFLHHSTEWNLVCKCLTSFEASFTVSGALIQTTWRPASGYGLLQKKKKTPRSHWLIQDGKWGVLMEKDNKHTRVEVTTWTEHKYTSTCIPTRGPWKAYLRPAKAVRLT